MYRIGILGTENSHAAAFTDLVNKADTAYPDFKVTALYALEKAPSEAIVARHPDDGIVIYDSVEEMVDKVDCAMITARHGKYHLPFALPFIKAGKPVFVDKPFTISEEDALTLIAAAKENNVPFTGGSGCKYGDELMAFKKDIESGDIGTVKNCILSFACDMHSEYGGFYFYAGHVVEEMMALFGAHPTSVSAFLKNDYLSAVVRYDALDVYLSFAKSYTATAFGDKNYIHRTVSTGNIYQYEMDHFTEMVRTGKSPLPEDWLLQSVRILNGIEKSLDCGAEVKL